MSFNALTDKTSTAVLPGAGFWPDLEVAEFQRLYRLPAEYTEALVLDHLSLARSWAVRLLSAWAEGHQAAGRANLEDVPLHGLPGEALRLYKRAVFCHAKGLLLPQFATIDRREAAKNEAKESPDTAAVFFAQAHDAIADLLGNGRIMCAAV